MKKLLRALKQWTLLIAIVVGAVGHSFFSQFTWLAPWLLASMLLLTFCNISPRDLRFHPLHLILMSLQIVMSLGLYALTLPWHPAIAQGVCMAALTPTATAAAIITGMLGGSVAFLAAYAFLSNLAIVVLAPLVLPLIATGQIDTPFLETMSNVFMRVGPTMLFPLLAAWLIQYAAPKVNAVLLRWGILAYYLWAGMLVILMGGTFEQLLKPGEKDYQLEIFLALTGIAVCTANFILGKSIGSRFHRRIAGGQALAQKNIILPMWLTFQYLDPIRIRVAGRLLHLPEHRQRRPDMAQRTPRRPHHPAPPRLPREKARPHTGRPTACPSGRTRRTSLGAAYPRQGQAQEVTGRPALKRSAPRSTRGNHRPPYVDGLYHGCLPTAQQAPREARSPQRKSPSKKALPPQRVPCTGSALLFSARHAAPNRPPSRPSPPFSESQTKRPPHASDRRCPPPEGGDIPLAAFAEGECLRGGKMRHPGWGQDAAIWG